MIETLQNRTSQNFRYLEGESVSPPLRLIMSGSFDWFFDVKRCDLGVAISAWMRYGDSSVESRNRRVDLDVASDARVRYNDSYVESRRVGGVLKQSRPFVKSLCDRPVGYY